MSMAQTIVDQYRDEAYSVEKRQWPESSKDAMVRGIDGKLLSHWFLSLQFSGIGTLRHDYGASANGWNDLWTMNAILR